KIAQQPRTAVALHNFVHRASEINIDDVEAAILAHLSCLRHHFGVGTKKLATDRMFIWLKVEVPEIPVGPFRRPCTYYPVRTRELGHQQPAAALIPNQAPENRIRDARHRS